MSQPFDGIVDETLKAFGTLQVVETVEAGGGSGLRSDNGSVVKLAPERIHIPGSEKSIETESLGGPAD